MRGIVRDLAHLGLALLGGALLTLGWPASGGLSPLLLVGLVPLMLVVELRCPPHGRCAQRGTGWMLFAGLALWNLITTSWLGEVQESQGTRLLLGVGVMLANAGLQLAAFAVGRRVRRRHGRWAGWAAFAAWWLCWEVLHMRWDLQWPWLTLGNGFAVRPQWVQWYEVTGHLGGSVWVLAVNLLVLRWMLTGGRLRAAWAPVLAMLLPVLASWVRFATYRERGAPLEVVVVQPNIDPYSEKFGGIDPLAQLDDMLALAEPLMTDSTRLLLLPETALQEAARVFLNEDGGLELEGSWENDLEASGSVRRIRAWQRRHSRCAVLAGISSSRLLDRQEHSITARPIGGTDRHFEAANAALFVDPQGGAAVYHKSKLVAGVELLPFQELLGGLEALSIDMGGTTGSLAQQEERSVFRPADRRFAAAPVICYESVFGDYVADYVRNGADLIAILTNDAWWGDSFGHRQHLAYASLRAIENRRAVARSANTGTSCFIDQRGIAHQATPWWEPTAIRGTVRLNPGRTPFVALGEVLRWAALLAGVIALWAAFLPWPARRRP
ncbi:MAG: Apolipoprotein N-acyltransferase [Flavobacteriales bacterium]|nr:Apolipoprotein N-acyltransferase [Flavobacteriales bacterium]